MTTPTPRTDAVRKETRDLGGWEKAFRFADLADALERALAAAQERIREFEEASEGLTRGHVGLINSLGHANSRINELEKELAAAQSENAKLKAHAEAMASAWENYEWDDADSVDDMEEAVFNHRRDFPKETP